MATPELTPERASKWVAWANSQPREIVDTWLKQRPHFKEEQIRGVATQYANPATNSGGTGGTAKDWAKSALSVAPDIVTGMAGVPRMVSDISRAGVNLGAEALNVQDPRVRKVLDLLAGGVFANAPTTEQIREGVSPRGIQKNVVDPLISMLPEGAKESLPEFVTRPKTEGYYQSKGYYPDQARKAATTTVDAFMNPMSLPMKAATAAVTGGAGWVGERVGGETGRAIGEMAGAILTPTSAAAYSKLPSWGKESRILSGLDSADLSPADLASAASQNKRPIAMNQRSKEAMRKYNPTSTSPEENLGLLYNEDPKRALVNKISEKYTGYKPDQLNEATDAAYDTFRATNPYTITDPDTVNFIKKMRKSSMWKDAERAVQYTDDTMSSGIKPSSSKNPKSFTIDPKQAEPFVQALTAQTTNKGKGIDYNKRKLLNEFIDALGNDDLIQARKLRSQAGDIEQNRGGIEKLVNQARTSDLDIEDALNKVGIQDPAMREELIGTVRELQDEYKTIASASGVKLVDIDESSVENKLGGLASFRHRLYSAILAKGLQDTPEQIKHMSDEIVNALLDADSPQWDKLQKSKMPGHYGAGAGLGLLYNLEEPGQ